MDPWLGHVIDGRYRLDARVAEGGFGTVYRAFHLGFERPVAVKLLRVEEDVAALLGPKRAQVMSELRAEGAVLQRLSSATVGVVQALDVGETTNAHGQWAPYLVMEWVEGESLSAWGERRGRASLEEAMRLLAPVAQALDTAHGMGIAHRDVKPGNILVTPDAQRTKLLDFGIAKVMTSDVLTRARAATRLSFLAFTPTWAAPEQFDPNLAHTGTWTDVYALALVLVGLLYGGRPYGAERLELALKALDREHRPTPRSLGLVVPDDVELVFARALAVDPANRPARAGELWEQLQRACAAPSARTTTGPVTIATGAHPSPVSAAAPEPGRVVGGEYRLVRPLSQGGMGSVFEAEQLRTHKRRALKLMHPSLVANPRLRERFEQEARVGARIQSEHIIDVIGAGVDAETGMPWLAMELLEGEDLATFLRQRGPMPLFEVKQVFEQLCHALGAAHQAGVVHRDLKPENVFLAATRRADASFTVKVLDFGIAKIVAEAESSTTGALGTPLWMAPEQAQAHAAITPAADVWSLGLLAYRLLTGRSYWLTGNEPEPGSMRILHEVMFGALPPPSVRARESGVALDVPHFDAWFARCVDRDPARRFPDANAAWAELVASVDHVPVAHSAFIPKPPRKPNFEAPGAGRGLLQIVLGLAILSIIGAGVWMAWPESPASSPTPAPEPVPTPKQPPKPAPKPKVPAGAVLVPGGGSPSGAWIGPFRMTESFAATDLSAAGAACNDKGLRLCTASQWAMACSYDPAVGRPAVWTSTWKSKSEFVVAGGLSCEQRSSMGKSDLAAYRCCSPAVAMDGMLAPEAKPLADKVLRYEACSNTHDAQCIADLFAAKVHTFHTLTNTNPTAIRKATATWFSSNPDEFTITDACEKVGGLLRCRKTVNRQGVLRGYEADMDYDEKLVGLSDRDAP